MITGASKNSKYTNFQRDANDDYSIMADYGIYSKSFITAQSSKFVKTIINQDSKEIN